MDHVLLFGPPGGIGLPSTNSSVRRLRIISRVGATSSVKRITGLLVWAVFATGCQGTELAPSVRPSASLSTDFVSGRECPPAPSETRLPSGTGCSTSVQGDSNGDGELETLTTYARLKKDRLPASWRLNLRSADRQFDQPLNAGNPYSYPHVVGAADVNGDGRDEWWIKVTDLTSHGAPWQTLNLFAPVGRKLRPVTFEGQPLDLNVGGIARLGEGVDCHDDLLIALRVEAQNVRNTRWRFSRRAFELEGHKAHFLWRHEGLLRIKDYNDPDLDAFYAVDCAGLRYPA